jgi:hypothetical protein
MDTFARPAEGAEDQKPTSKAKAKARSKITAFGSSYRDWVYSVRNLVGCQAAIAGKPAPTI